MTPTSAPLDFFEGYKYFYENAGSNSQRADGLPCCNITSGTVPGSTSTLFDLDRPDVVSVSGDWDNIFTDVSQLDEQQSATNCSIITQAPTAEPTRAPTQDPTKDPTNDPTTNPTSSPTLRDLYIPSCKANVLATRTLFNMTWEAALFDPPFTASARFVFHALFTSKKTLCLLCYTVIQSM